MTNLVLSTGRVVKWAIAPAGRAKDRSGQPIKQRTQLDIRYDSLSNDDGIIPVSDAETLEAVTAINEAIHGPQPPQETA